MSQTSTPERPTAHGIGILNRIWFEVVPQDDPRITRLDDESIFSVKKLRVLPEGMEVLPYSHLIKASVAVNSVVSLVQKTSVRESVTHWFLPFMHVRDCAWEMLVTSDEGNLNFDVIVGYGPLVGKALLLLEEEAPIALDPALMLQQASIRKFLKGQ